MKPAEKLLPHLDRVKSVGNDRWKASCPTSLHAHGDRSAGLHISELEDGRLLLHCFAGCEVTEIVGAVGLELSDLFPDSLDRKRHSHQRSYKDALQTIRHEAMVLSVAADRFEELLSSDIKRVKEAGRKIREVLYAIPR